MAKKLQILRGTTAQNDAYTGSVGELTMDTEKVEVRIHDGTTQGGKIIGSSGGSMPDRYVESINGWTGNVFLGAHEIGTYTTDEIDNKILVINESIDAQTDAIAKTRDDMNEKDSQLESMITTHTGELTTLRGNQATLGGQVSGIEAKIPESASETNPLITKQQLLDEETDIRKDMDNAVSELQTQITAQTSAIAGKQDKLIPGDGIAIVDNVISATAATAINYSHVTNCITEIPQDIKLELADGAIILKAGSKVYVPNGSGNYTETTIENDLSRTVTSGFEGILVYYPEENRLSSININYCSSGTVLPSAPIETNHWVHYKTDDNRIYYTADAGETWSRTYSLPLCIFTSEETGIPEEATITKINQVFNGFGYIGSTIFVLPGVKGLVPNGRNDDGTLKNTLRTTTNVSVYTVTTPANYEYQLAYNGTVAPFYSHMTYNAEENINYNTSGTISAWGIVGSVKFNNNTISKLTPKTAFHAVDYSDFGTLSDTVETNNDNAVHKTGDETVLGVKTFEHTIKTGAGTGIQITGTNNNFVLRSSGATPEGCGLFLDNDANIPAFNANSSKITIGSNAIAPHSVTPGTSDNSTRIATTAFVCTKDSNTVHRTGNETIGGEKTFTSQIVVKDCANAYRIANGEYGSFWRQDEKNLYLMLTNAGDPTGAWNNLRPFVLDLATGATRTITPSHSSNDTSIATTAFVKSVLSSSGNGFATISKAQNGYCKFNNGLIIQWGLTPVINAQAVYVSLPTPFTTNHYAVAGNMNFSGGSNVISFYDLTTTGFKTRVGAGGYSYWFIAIGY